MNRFRKTVAALAVTAAATVALAAPADANIGATKWARGTIFVEELSPTDPVAADVTYAINYLESLASSNGVNWNIVAGACRTNSPCVHVMIGNWGNTGWVGLTYPAYTCSAGVFCSWDGTSTEFADHSSQTWTLSKINKAAGYTDYQYKSVAVHELGHAIPQLNHSSGSTAMQATPGQYITYQATEVIEIRDKFAGITR